MLNIGIIGFGLMGRTHFNAWQKIPGAKISAICDTIFADGKPLEEISGNIGSGNAVDLSGIDLFTDCDEMLANSDLDAVSIALPTFLHAQFTIKAFEAGLHVLCEKPMALNPQECQAMIDAAQKYDKILQIGHCIRFWPEYVKLKEIVDSEKYGKILFGDFYRLSANPGWTGSSWFNDETSSGGMVLDLHIHDTDFILYLLGTPEKVNSTGSTTNGIINHVQSQFFYKNQIAISAVGSWAMSEKFPFRMGFIVGLEKATIEFNSAAGEGLRIFPNDAESFIEKVSDGDGYSNEIAHFAKRIAGENVPEIITPEGSMHTVKITLAEKESVINNCPVNTI
jgi:predicted dehydrogenase